MNHYTEYEKIAAMRRPLKSYTIVYCFNHSKMGFSNEITLHANAPNDAIDLAKKEISDCYGSDKLKRFSFKLK